MSPERNHPANPRKYHKDIIAYEHGGYRMHDHPDIKEARRAKLRTIANVIITLSDIVPVTEGVSLTADAVKILSRTARALRIYAPIDLTPDVGVGTSVGTEILEVPTGGVLPSHLAETTLQLKEDWKRIRRGRLIKKEYKIWQRAQKRRN